MNVSIELKDLEAHKYTKPQGRVHIKNNSTLLNVRGGGDSLSADFVYTSTYDPNIGLIRLEGELNVVDKPENISTALEEWSRTKEKNLPKGFAEKIHNQIISTCILQASILARDLKLPAPMPAPKVSIGKEEKPDTDSYIR
ncbi:MAG: hypothetical protein GF334_06605 [Candidatus Altiarchaeales archaeon]|nr:hypothetical protein [Candidatus Altiarchaeales archaeon]